MKSVVKKTYLDGYLLFPIASKKGAHRMKGKKLIILIVIMFTVAFMAATVAVVAVTNLSIGTADTLPATDYEVFFIEGMPCVRVYRIDGISCDWSKWNGR